MSKISGSNLGYPINTHRDEKEFVLSVDGVIIKKAVVTKNKKYYDQTHTIKKPLKKIDNYYKSKVA